MKQGVGRYLSNFEEGIYTGLDPIGLVLGHLIKGSDSYLARDRGYLIGYSSDRFGIDGESNDRKSRDTPKERNILEQMIKGVGTGIGLCFAPVFEFIITDYIVSHFKGRDIHPEKHYIVPVQVKA